MRKTFEYKILKCSCDQNTWIQDYVGEKGWQLVAIRRVEANPNIRIVPEDELVFIREIAQAPDEISMSDKHSYGGRVGDTIWRRAKESRPMIKPVTEVQHLQADANSKDQEDYQRQCKEAEEREKKAMKHLEEVALPQFYKSVADQINEAASRGKGHVVVPCSDKIMAHRTKQELELKGYQVRISEELIEDHEPGPATFEFTLNIRWDF